MQLLRARVHTRAQTHTSTPYIVIQIDRTWRARKIKSAVCRLSRVFSSPRVTNVIYRSVPFAYREERLSRRGTPNEKRIIPIRHAASRKCGRSTSNQRIVSSWISQIALFLFPPPTFSFFPFLFSQIKTYKTRTTDEKDKISDTMEGKNRRKTRVRVVELTLNATGCRCRAHAVNFHCIRKCIDTKRPRNEFTRKTAGIYRHGRFHSWIASLAVVIDQFARDSRYSVARTRK